MFQELLLSVTQYFRSEMKLNRASYFLSYFFCKQQKYFVQNRQQGMEKQSVVNHVVALFQNYSCVLESQMI